MNDDNSVYTQFSEESIHEYLNMTFFKHGLLFIAFSKGLNKNYDFKSEEKKFKEISYLW